MRNKSVKKVEMNGGITRPRITFSFSPLRSSLFPQIAASVKTLVVSWNDAADINDSVAVMSSVILGSYCSQISLVFGLKAFSMPFSASSNQYFNSDGVK